MLQRGSELKREPRTPSAALQGKVVALLFEKPSTRTRVSFEAGILQAGGHVIVLSKEQTQLSRGETLADTARVLSSMVDLIMVRTTDHQALEEFTRHSQVPVINGLSNTFHPCQVLADMQTYEEERGTIQGRTVCWVGDGNNMCQTYIHAAQRFDFQLKIACPEGFGPDPALLKAAGDRVQLTHEARLAARQADLLVTDVWTSMGQEEGRASNKQRRQSLFSSFQLNRELLDLAAPDALFMHCLPAHRGEEISAELLDDEKCVIWKEAANRLPSQRALMEFLLCQAQLKPPTAS